MKANAHRALAAGVLAWLIWPSCGNSQLQSIPLSGPVTGGLSAVTYFDPPNEQRVKCRVTGTDMTPLPEAQYDVKNLRIEQYNLGGKLLSVVESPQCVYSPMDMQISSANHLTARLQGGAIHLEGDGFLWQQTNGSLYISNNVTTLLKPGTNAIFR